MFNQASLEQRIGQIFEETLHLVVPSTDTDLFATGGLDSLSFVDLLLELERQYEVKVSLDDLELDNFRSIEKIAGFIAQRLDGKGGEMQARAAIEPADRRRAAEHG